MRIIGGEWRGRKLEEPRGREVTRPTTDRVREAMASMVGSALESGIDGARVLDAFGGSGALGIEMLSRGAGHLTVFDLDRGASALIKRNLATVRCDPSRFKVISGDVLASAVRGRIPGGPFALVLFDPPYALGPGCRLYRKPTRPWAFEPGLRRPLRALLRHPLRYARWV